MIFEEGVLYDVDGNSGTSLRTLVVAARRSRTFVYRKLQGKFLHPFHAQSVQLLQLDNHPRRVMFAQWFVNQRVTDMNFASSILLCEEANFPLKKVINMHNPDSTRSRTAQQHFIVNV